MGNTEARGGIVQASSPWARLVVRSDGVFLLAVGLLAMTLEAVGHFTGAGPLGRLSNSAYTIGGFEAHGLAAIFGALLLHRSSDADLRPWHWYGLVIHMLLGGANLAFWVSFTKLDMVIGGIVTTAAHALFVALHAGALDGDGASA